MMIGEFSLVGHVVQALGRDVWVYVHTRSKREVFVDSDGQAYRRHPDRRTKAGARFVACSPRADAEASGEVSPRVSLLMAIRDKLALALREES